MKHCGMKDCTHYKWGDNCDNCSRNIFDYYKHSEK